MPRTPLIASIEELTEDHIADIVRLYVVDRKPISVIGTRTHVRRKVVSDYLRDKDLIRSMSEHARASPWFGANRASWAKHRAAQRGE